ncbi:hypothetical protein AEM51_00535 [Bacteroidetes bacterium UKL13-3]|nr:hypothetical protein AEM51_00535 [Bacteroidetes bacterium UKL13-3]
MGKFKFEIMEKEYFEMCLTEAKEQLKHINSSIKETRSKIYFLQGILIAVVGYLLNDIFKEDYFSLKSNMLYVTIPFMIFIIYSCRHAIVPLSLRFEGMSPNGFKSIIEQEDTLTHENVLNTYQVSIETNGRHLTVMSKGYNNAFKALLFWLFCCCLCIIVVITKSLVC